MQGWFSVFCQEPLRNFKQATFTSARVWHVQSAHQFPRCIQKRCMEEGGGREFPHNAVNSSTPVLNEWKSTIRGGLPGNVRVWFSSECLESSTDDMTSWDCEMLTGIISAVNTINSELTSINIWCTEHKLHKHSKSSSLITHFIHTPPLSSNLSHSTCCSQSTPFQLCPHHHSYPQLPPPPLGWRFKSSFKRFPSSSDQRNQLATCNDNEITWICLWITDNLHNLFLLLSSFLRLANQW